VLQVVLPSSLVASVHIRFASPRLSQGGQPVHDSRCLQTPSKSKKESSSPPAASDVYLVSEENKGKVQSTKWFGSLGDVPLNNSRVRPHVPYPKSMCVSLRTNTEAWNHGQDGSWVTGERLAFGRVEVWCFSALPEPCPPRVRLTRTPPSLVSHKKSPQLVEIP
jgi:hypothetical protein